ncbi:MAG: hypothetical protein R2822_17855 [Spirosomataceae bacterium]
MKSEKIRWHYLDASVGYKPTDASNNAYLKPIAVQKPMIDFFEKRIENIRTKKTTARIHVQTLGNFQVWREGEMVSPKEWGRSKKPWNSLSFW